MKKNLFLFILLIGAGSLKAQHDTAIFARVFSVVQIQPRFKGDVNKYLAEHIQYPESAIKAGLSGVVFVGFIVEKNGSLSNIKVVRGVSDDINREAIRVVNAMPAWSPGYNAGDTVRVQYVLPVRFSLDHLKLSSDTLNKDTAVIYEPDVSPQFNGDLQGYVQAHLQYPRLDIDQDIEGTVYVTFMITKTGKIKAPMILRGVDSSLNRAALSIVMNMPDWIPGTIQNVPVNVQYTLPVVFKINGYTGNPETYNPTQPDSRGTPVYQRRRDYPCKYTRWGTWIEPHVAIGTSWIFMTDGDAKNTFGGSPAFGAVTGCDIGFMLNDKEGLVTGLQIQQYGSNYSSALTYGFPQAALPPNATAHSSLDTSTISDHSTSVKYTFNYLQVPIMFRHISSDACNVGLHFEGGLLIGYLISASESGTVTTSVDQWGKIGSGIGSFYEYAGNSMISQSPNSTPDASKLDFELVAKVGVMIPLTSGTSLALDFISEIKLNSAGNGSKDVVTYENSTYSYYGPGNYDGGLAFLISAKLLFYTNRQ